MEKTKREKDLPSQEYLKERIDYNPDTGLSYWKERPLHQFKNKGLMNTWNKGNVNKVAGSLNNVSNYIAITIDGECYMLHRIIWKWYYGTEPKELIDHINGVRTDNRICNLREATYSENTKNINVTPKNNTTGHIGITFSKNRYYARISVNGKRIGLGYYKTLEEAIYAREKAAREYHGEFYSNTTNIDFENKEYIDECEEKISKKSNSKSGYFGVYETEKSGYIGHITIEGKRYYTKVFNTPEEASIARENKLKELKSLNTTET
jgi:hypothetical protein